jgi:hypothetical protein
MRTCQKSHGIVTNDIHCCAERNLFKETIFQARRKGVASYKVIAWIKRKHGSDLTVWRERVDGTLGCSIPCSYCKKVIEQFGMRVHVLVDEDNWYHGYLDEENAPVSKLTSGQSYRHKNRV